MHFTTAALVAALVATASAWSQVNHCYSSGPGNYNKENIINELPALCNMISGYFVETQTRFGSLADGNNCWDFYITKSSKNAGIMTAGDCVANIGGQINVCANGGLTRQGSPSWDFSAQAMPGACTNPQPDLSNLNRRSLERRSPRDFLVEE